MRKYLLMTTMLLIPLLPSSGNGTDQNMQIDWMERSWENQFYKGKVHYRPNCDDLEVSKKLSDFKDGAFYYDPYHCTTIAWPLKITTSVDRFFEIGRDYIYSNVVILLTTRQLVAQKCNSPEHPLYSLLAKWDPNKIGIIWRIDGDTDLTRFDYLIDGLEEISSRYLGENMMQGSHRAVPPQMFLRTDVRVDFTSKD
jgi:hypothetical protein